MKSFIGEQSEADLLAFLRLLVSNIKTDIKLP